MVHVRFCSLSGKFTVGKAESFESIKEAENAVKAYVEPYGYTNVKFVEDADDNARFTAKTPGGRNGRNVAMVDFE